MADGGIVAAVGEAGVGPGDRCSRRPRATRIPATGSCRPARPRPTDVETWLGLWTPELGKPHTAVVVRDVDLLPAWVAEQLRDLVLRHGSADAGDSVPFCDDRRTRSRTSRPRWPPSSTRWCRCRRCASAPTTSCRWPTTSPSRVRGRDVDVHAVGRRGAARLRLAGQRRRARRGWSRDAARPRRRRSTYATCRPRCLSGTHAAPVAHRGVRARRDRPGAHPAGRHDGRRPRDELGMSRATLYRKIAQYDIHVPRSGS